MDKEFIYKKLKRRYPDQEPEDLRAITADIYYSGIAEDLMQQNLDSMLARYKSKKASGSTLKVQADDPNACPICKSPLQPVKLDASVNAVFCAKHFVVFPAKDAAAEE